MSADSEKPNITGGIGWNIALWQKVWVGIGQFLSKWTVASSQALPALKVALDDECSGKGLAFTKNNPPDFGLLFLAQFARFSIRTETEVTVRTHSQTNRHLHLCPARSGLWKFGFVGPLASTARWAGSISDQASGPAAEPVSKLWMSSLVLTFTKSKPSTARSATHFSMSAHHISSMGPQLQFDRHVQTSFENNLFRPTGEWEKRRQRHGSVQSQTPWISSGLACFFFFFTLQTFAEDGPCHPTVRISKPKRHLLYVR